MRGRNRNNKGPNPLTRSYESNGPDVKIRGTAQHIAEKYAQLARDAQGAGDPIAAENYLQHAEHYFRIIAASQEQIRQQYGQYQRLPDDDQDDSDIEENGNGYAYDGGEQPIIEDMEFAPQPSPESSPVEGRRETRHLRRGRYGRLDRSHKAGSGGDQPRFSPESGDEEQAASARNSRQEQPVERTPRRRAAAPRVTSEDDGSSSLPAFLTTPLRQPAAAAKTETRSENLFGEPEESEPVKPVRRRRRTTVPSDEAEAGADKV